MYEEIEFLRSRTDELLVQVLSQWSASVMSSRDRGLPPYSSLAADLAAARDRLAAAAQAAVELDGLDYVVECDEVSGEERVEMDVETREVKSTTVRKGGRK
ncbi:hypothetical protein [Ruegeria sp. PrR005]|uniref:Uncharacterized protein n=1 Tax=Ruegeria sp. PrR005 TaxID=2706882 RepID=A0A6B2NNQ5_9RHOB|nr:hypothetical protein [Ruegeria sp. PrR005]NDW44603.1 hypothetical protein [Ruegeria sp. PrR005]